MHAASFLTPCKGQNCIIRQIQVNTWKMVIMSSNYVFASFSQCHPLIYCQTRRYIYLNGSYASNDLFFNMFRYDCLWCIWILLLEILIQGQNVDAWFCHRIILLLLCIFFVINYCIVGLMFIYMKWWHN